MAPRRRTNHGANRRTNQRTIQITNHELTQATSQRANQVTNQGTIPGAIQSTNEGVGWRRTSTQIIQSTNPLVNQETRGMNQIASHLLNLGIIQGPNQGWFNIPGRRRNNKKRPTKRGKIIKKPKDPKVHVTRVLVKIRCPLCFKTFGKEPAVATACGHVFCKDCLETWLKDHNRCPVCSTSCRKKDHHTVYLEDMGEEESVNLSVEDIPIT